MKLDDTAKVATMVSVVVGIIISVTGWITNRQIQSSQEEVSKLIRQEKEVGVQKGRMDLQKAEYDESARLSADFAVPLARSFAVIYKQYLSDKDHLPERYFVPPALMADIEQMWPTWHERVGLMVGDACEAKGLVTRQIIVLVLKNFGRADTQGLVLTVLEKPSPVKHPNQAWFEKAGKELLAYDALPKAEGWKRTELTLPDLHGTSVPDAERKPLKVVLASVSGRNTLYGTVIVPLQLSWSDKVTNKRQTLPLMQAQAAMLNAELMGAEIGRPVSTCDKLKTAAG